MILTNTIQTFKVYTMIHHSSKILDICRVTTRYLDNQTIHSVCISFCVTIGQIKQLQPRGKYGKPLNTAD